MSMMQEAQGKSFKIFLQNLFLNLKPYFSLNFEFDLNVVEDYVNYSLNFDFDLNVVEDYVELFWISFFIDVLIESLF